jgi:hypothetical protein
VKSRLPEVPVLKRSPGAVRAATYNRVLRTFARLGSPQELVLGDRGLHFLLARELWLCSDCRLDGTPLVAWSRFEGRGRAGVHLPVACQMLYYHAFGTVIEQAALNDLDRRLAARLAETQEARPVGGGPRVLFLRRIER